MITNPGQVIDFRDELPDRIAHRKRVAENLNRAAEEHPRGSPGREVHRPGGHHSAEGPGAITVNQSLNRGAHQ